MSDPTNDMPARIWATGNDHTGCWNVRDVQTCPGVDYIRADHALALVAEVYEVAAREADCGCAGRAAILDAGTKTDRWRACGTDPCGAETAQFIRSLTPSDALAAREADRKRVRREALREAAACADEHTHVMHPEEVAKSICALIEGDQTDE